MESHDESFDELSEADEAEEDDNNDKWKRRRRRRKKKKRRPSSSSDYESDAFEGPDSVIDSSDDENQGNKIGVFFLNTECKICPKNMFKKSVKKFD